MSSSCDCSGDTYKGCLKQANNLYVCYKKDGTIDATKSCSGQKINDVDGNEGWTKGCGTLTYQDLKTRMTKWCTKLYQDGIYDYNQYQDCLENLDTGTVDYYKKDISSGVDDEKDVSRIYGYYQKGLEKVDNTNPNKPIIKDDFEKIMLYHTKQKAYLVCDETGNITLNISPEIRDERNWQLIDLGKGQIYGLKSSYGKFLTATDNDTLECIRDDLTPWAQWKLIKQNETFAFQSVSHNKYLTLNGDQPFIKQGWTDNNLWLLQKKTESSASYLTSYDKSGLIEKKDELVNLMDNNYRKAVDNKFKRDYYTNKISQLKYLRDQQKEYLLSTVLTIENQLNENKDKILEELTQLKSIINKPADKNKIQYDSLVLQYTSECDMNEECLNSALEYSSGVLTNSNSNSSSSSSSSSNSITTSNPTNDNLVRLQNIKNKQTECKWTNTQTANIVSNSFKPPTDEYCTDLNIQKETLGDILSKSTQDYQNIMNDKNNMLKDINYQLLDLDLFKNDIKDQFSTLNDTEKQKITLIVNDAEKLRLDNLDKFRQSETNVNNYINTLTTSNRSIENEISGITEDIDTQLTENNKLELNIQTNQLLTSKKDTNEIIKTNKEILLNKLSNTKKDFYVGIFGIIILIFFILFMSYKIYYKIKK